jgi:hypothetical protein
MQKEQKAVAHRKMLRANNNASVGDEVQQLFNALAKTYVYLHTLVSPHMCCVCVHAPPPILNELSLSFCIFHNLSYPIPKYFVVSHASGMAM